MKKFKLYFHPLIIQANSKEEAEEIVADKDYDLPEVEFISEVD